MKRIVFLLLLTVLFFSLKNGAQKRNDLSEMNLRDKVRTIREVRYEAIDNKGKITKGDYIPWAHFYSFNEKGYKISECLSHPDSTDASKVSYTYDKLGNRTEINIVQRDGKPGMKITSRYDAKGFETERNVANAGNSFGNWKTIYKYDASGNKVEENLSFGGSASSKIIFQYDDKGNLAETRQIENNGSLSVGRKYKYDNKGNKVEMRNEQGGLLRDIFTYTYEFDSHLNWIRQIEYDDGKANAVIERDITYY